ncbi:hypothetical protein Tco_0120268, partial [Tanacetum coccineum]
GVVVWRRGGGVRGVGIEAVLAAGWRRDGDDGGMMMMMEVAGCGCRRGLGKSASGGEWCRWSGRSGDEEAF